MNANFRPEIEGLRAVSILSVLFYHVGFSFVSGGYLGVDVFFVVSGFLITQIILKEVQSSGRFSLKNFYVRRARRLLPSLMTVLLLSSIFSFLILSPAHLLEYGQSLPYSILGLANVYFYQISGYFETLSSFKPLLHSWSLAVEEQFYLFWPVTLMFVARLNVKYILLIIFCACVASLSINYYWLAETSARFYLTPFRVFELLIGAIIAIFPINVKTHLVRIVSTALGVVAIVASMLVFDDSINHPSLLTLIPCLGAAMVIIGGYNVLSKLVLANRLMMYIGERSYTIYLVHWPLIVLYGYGRLSAVTAAEMIALVASSILIAIPIYRWVEDPFRKKQYSFDRFKLITIPRVAIAALILVFAVSSSFVLSDGAKWRVNSQSLEWEDNSLYGGEICAIPCYVNEEAHTKLVYVVGDSFARQLASGLKATFPNTSFKIFDHRQCTFFSPTWIAYEQGYIDKCLEEQKAFFDEIIKERPKIIFANHWAREVYFVKAQGEIVKREFGRYDKDHADFILGEIEKFQAKFDLDQALIVGNPPSIGALKDLDMCINRPLWLQREVDSALCAFVSRKDSEARRYLFEARHSAGQVIDLFEPFCDENRCKTMTEDGFYFSDNVHLTKLGSRKAVSYFSEQFKAWLDL